MKYKVLNLNILILFISFLNPVQSAAQEEITFGDQIWSLRNLNTEIFRNGDKIPEAKTKEEWHNFYKLKQPAWCFYDFDKDNESKFGRLYNWYAVNDQRNISPVGWHIPNNKEWEKLIEYAMKSADVIKVKQKYWDNSLDARKGKIKTRWASELNKSSDSNKFWFSQLGGYEHHGFTNKESEVMWWTKDGNIINMSGDKKKLYVPTLMGISEEENDYSGGYAIRCIKN